MSWRTVLEDRCRLGGLKESSLTVYLSCGNLFEDWLKSKHKVTFDDLIHGNSQMASNFVSDYVNGYLRSAEIGYRKTVLKILCSIFQMNGRPLLSRPSVG